jgi:competence protein ComEA
MKNKQKFIGSIIILVCLIIFLVIGLYLNRPKDHKLSEDDIFVQSTFTSDKTGEDSKTITVYIKGEVKSPGVYKLKSGSIVEDLVKTAGGFTLDANPDSKVNLAKKLKDEDYIVIDKKPETAAGSENSKAAQQPNSADTAVNINEATLEELDKIPGIGPVTAQKIIDYRDQYGSFNSVEDLKKVGGIGDKTLAKFRDKVDIR